MLETALLHLFNVSTFLFGQPTLFLFLKEKGRRHRGNFIALLQKSGLINF